MHLSISNIAWDVCFDDDIAKVLQSYGIKAIDVAPGKYFPNIKEASISDMIAVKTWWADNGISLYGMQSLLFGTNGLNVFGTEAQQNEMLEHLRYVCLIGSQLGATRLVFGSPKNRDCSVVNSEQILPIAYNFFYKLGEIAKEEGVLICLEPNPPVYGANFLMTTEETLSFVSLLNHPAIKIQLDTGAIWINNESAEIIKKVSPWIGHIHISESGLTPIGTHRERHTEFASLFHKLFPDRTITLEMLTNKTETINTISHSLSYALKTYGINYEQ